MDHFDSFQDHLEEKIVDLQQNKRRKMTEDTMTDSSIIIICTVECLHRCFLAFLVTFNIISRPS